MGLQWLQHDQLNLEAFSEEKKYQKLDPRQSLKQFGEAQIETESNTDHVSFSLS